MTKENIQNEELNEEAVVSEAAESSEEAQQSNQVEENSVEIEIEEADVLEEAIEGIQTVSVKDSDEYKDLSNKYLRLHAEFDNYRRRTARENLELVDRANSKILGELCEVVDNFDRAIETEGGADNHEDFSKGIHLIAGQFKKVLVDFGLETIDPSGTPFDPNEHEALMQQPSEEVEADHILQVFQKGYKVKDKVIRHAKVIVSAGA